ncbi:MAG: glycoside hydrolase [Gammaproteobacteria bacterium]
MEAERLKIVLCWHMHQPEYRDGETGQYRLPWAYLHAIKDYVDMAAHLEAEPQARAVVNFSPVLLEQIDDYARQIRAHLEHSVALRDPMLAALAAPGFDADPGARLALIKGGLRAHEERLIKRFAPYKRLAEIAAWAGDRLDTVAYLNDQFIADLLVWQHLAWLGETVRRGDVRIRQLMDKAALYTLDERRALLAIIGELLGCATDRYRRLAERGQVELSLTPYAHPIVPLLLDIESARQAAPHLPLPELKAYPGGADRARWHITQALDVFEQHFGFAPQGCWPSEGAVSEATLKLLADAGFRWVASGENVLRNSLKASHITSDVGAFQAYRLHDMPITAFFRDDALSDLIGFTYSTWHADDAVADLIHRLENIAVYHAHKGAVVSIIMDGENAWDHYPENAYHFLNALYRKLTTHRRLRLATYSQLLEEGAAPVELKRLIAGSWVHGTLSTWIGDPDKNRAWDMLGDAKRCFDRLMAAGKLDADQTARATRQLAVCEGSDWFWWFGAYNPAAAVSDFDRLYRLNLTYLYRLLGETPPVYLSTPFTHGGGAPKKGGVMRPGQAAG